MGRYFSVGFVGFYVIGKTHLVGLVGVSVMGKTLSFGFSRVCHGVKPFNKGDGRLSVKLAT